MRKLAMAVLLWAVAVMAGSGCIMVIGVEEPIEVDGQGRIVEIDDQLYVVDVEKQTVRKFESSDLDD
jgi:hypothetical protein